MTTTTETRRESYERILPGLLDSRASVLAALYDSPGGLTAEDVSEYIGKPSYQVRPRLTELLQAGQIHVVGKRMSETTGRNIAVFRITTSPQSGVS